MGVVGDDLDDAILVVAREVSPPDPKAVREVDAVDVANGLINKTLLF